MALLYGRAGRLTAQNGGFRPGKAIALADELLYRSVLSSYFTEALAGRPWDPAGGAIAIAPFAPLPALLSALCFGAVFLRYRGEWLVGVAIAMVMQGMAAACGSLLPCVATHAVMELLVALYRSRQPVPKAHFATAGLAVGAAPRGNAPASGGGLHVT
jgi:hypothetical protein